MMKSTAAARRQLRQPVRERNGGAVVVAGCGTVSFAPMAAALAAGRGEGAPPSSTFWFLLHGALLASSRFLLGFRLLAGSLLSSSSSPPHRLLLGTLASHLHSSAAWPVLAANSPPTTTTDDYATTTHQHLHRSSFAAANPPVQTRAKPAPALERRAAGADKGVGTSGNPQSHVWWGGTGFGSGPWPHPDPVEVMRAHQIMERVQEEQRRWYVLRSRGRAIRREEEDGVVVFADDSNVHSMELFDEVQKVQWMGAVSVGILAHTGAAEQPRLSEEEKQNMPLPVQGPACNSSGHLAGWHTFNSLPFSGKTATVVGEAAPVLPKGLEWAGFVLNSRMLWKDAEGKPDWVKDLDAVGENGEEIENPLNLLNDPSSVEPLGNCGEEGPIVVASC
ncbi:hypothetical protein HU200_005993 [Digitaria exilis]|uniref:Glycosyltransferases n=1 Tax=Digitaria exilis TaxID=1010633 RepID=A0A835FS28_9POAL|nr:hypothetical protein HU200_005993 [Digitaria exilis]